ncbi:MAG TPA: MMPL family transporter [Blastocatellia bacterium]|nr:MMPL family transporter [Blastocatellia bacterium]
MVRLIRFSARHPKIVLAAVAFLTILLCTFIPRVRLQLDARSLIPSGDPTLTASDNAANIFGPRDIVAIGVVNEGSGIYSPETLKRIDRLSKRLSEVKGVVAQSVMSITTLSGQTVRGGKVIPYDLMVKGADLDSRAIQQLRADVERFGLADGALVGKDGKAAAIFAEVDPYANRYDLLQEVRSLLAAEQGGEDSLYLTGTALAQAVLGLSAAGDLARLVPAVILVVGCMLMLAFRHPAPALFSLAEIGISLLWTVGLMGLGGQSVFVTTLVLPVILVSVGVSDDVYALTHYFNHQRTAAEASIEDGVTDAFVHLIRPVGLTAISTIVGLSSLTVTGLEPLRVFGMYGAIAILFSTLFTFTLIPALLVVFHPKPVPNKDRHGSWDGPVLKLYRGLIAAGPRHALLIVLVVTASSALLATRLQVDDSWVANLPPNSDISRGDKALNELLAGTTTVDFLVDNGQSDGYLNPQTFAALGAIEDAVATLPFVGAVESVYTDVARAHAFASGVDYSEYRRGLQFNVVRLSRDRIKETFELLSSAPGPPLAKRLDGSYRQARVTVFVRSANYRRIESVLRTAQAAGTNILRAGGSITPFGDGWISYVTVRLLVRGQVFSIPLALITDFILLSVFFRSIRTGLIAILPVAFSVLAVFAALAVAKIPLGIANSMFAGIAIGIGLDFSIHLTTTYWQGIRQGLAPFDCLTRAFAGTGPPIIISAVAIASGFSVLAISEVAPNLQLGLIVSLTLLVCAAATLILIPSILLLGKKRPRP